MAKLFTLAASGKATPEMMDTDLDELFQKQRALPKEKQLKLSQTLTDMFPEDAVDMDAYLQWKYTPFAQSLFEAGAQSEQELEQQSLLQMSGGQQNLTDPQKKDALLQVSAGEQDPRDTLQKDKNWNPYYDDWRERGLNKPSMRGPWTATRQPQLEKNLRMSEEMLAKDNCIPDGWMSCFTKDVTYLPCRTFNMCMAAFGNSQSQFNFYAPTAWQIPKALANMGAAATQWNMGTGICHAVNAMSLVAWPERMQPVKALIEDYEAGGPWLKERVPCTVAFNGNMKLFKLGTEIKEMEADKILHPKKHATGSKAKKAKAELDNLKQAYGYELGKEIEEWYKDPVAMYNKRRLLKVEGMANAGAWVNQRESLPVPKSSGKNKYLNLKNR